MRFAIVLLASMMMSVVSAEVVAPPAPLPPPGAGPLGGGGMRVANGFLADPLWDDGLAEVSHFELSQFRYGRIHQGGHATLIVVREAMDPARAVKAGRGVEGGIPVLKSHLVKSFQTGVYRYEQASTVLLARADGVPLRLLISSHEWCGSAGKSWVNNGAGSMLRVMSYFDGHGDLEQPCELPADGVLEDALWTWLRQFDWSEGAESVPLASFQLVPSQLEARTVSTAPIAVVVAQRKNLQATVPAGSFAAVEVTLTARDAPPAGDTVFRPRDGALRWRFTFERAMPRRLLRFVDGSGTELALRSVSRTDYWNHHLPEDAPPSEPHR